MPEIYLFGDSSSQGIILDDDGKYRVSRAGCIRLLKRKGYPIRNYAVHGYTVLDGLAVLRKCRLNQVCLCDSVRWKRL